MDVLMNGESSTLDASDCANLAELVALAEREEEGGESCVVVGLEVDGHRFSPDEMSGLESHSLGQVRRVAIERRPARAIARAVLRQGADYTAPVCRALERTVAHLREGRVADALELFAHLTDSLTVLVGISSSAAGVLGEEADTLIALQQDLLPWLEELVEAQSVEDPIRMGDILEFEIAARVERWGECMERLARADERSVPADGAGGASLGLSS